MPENVKFTLPVAETVVVVPETETVHCCVLPLVWVTCPNVTGPAVNVPAASATAKAADKARSGTYRLKDLMVIFLVYFS